MTGFDFFNLSNWNWNCLEFLRVCRYVLNTSLMISDTGCHIWHALFHTTTAIPLIIEELRPGRPLLLPGKLILLLLLLLLCRRYRAPFLLGLRHELAAAVGTLQTRYPLRTSFKSRQEAGRAPTCSHVSCSTGYCLPAKLGSEASMCPVAPDPASLIGGGGGSTPLLESDSRRLLDPEHGKMRM
jgi:hypothetical protein